MTDLNLADYDTVTLIGNVRPGDLLVFDWGQEVVPVTEVKLSRTGKQIEVIGQGYQHTHRSSTPVARTWRNEVFALRRKTH